MLSIHQARGLADWVNTHDDGTPQPRAEIEALRVPGRWRVAIRSTVLANGEDAVETDHAASLAEARNILGY
jgi:hypothetical protein